VDILVTAAGTAAFGSLADSKPRLGRDAVRESPRGDGVLRAVLPTM